MKFVLFCLFYFSIFSYSGGYFFTRFADFESEGHGSLSLGYEQFYKQDSFNQNTFKLLNLPIRFETSLVKNVQVGIQFPLVRVYDFRKGTWGELVGGDFDVDFVFAYDDLEYNYRGAFQVGVKYLAQSPPINTDLRLDNTNTIFNLNPSANFTSDEYYPLVKHNNEYYFSWFFNKRVFEDTHINFNFKYVYELTNGESVASNLLGELKGFINEDSANADEEGLDKFKNASFSLFGVEKIFQKLFWTTSLTDPWSDKANDHIEMAFSIDTFINTDYYIGKKRLPLSLKPFFEVSYFKRFSQESLYRSRLLFLPGVWVKVGKHVRYLFALSHSVWEEQFFSDYATSLYMSIKLQF